MLYGSYIHEKDHAQYDLCDAGVYSRDIINMIFVCEVSGLVKKVKHWDLLRHDKCLTLHDVNTH